MRALVSIKNLDSGQVGPDGPANPLDCCVHLNLELGASDEDGQDLFFLTVATPQGLARQIDGAPWIWSGGLLIVDRFDWDGVESAIRSKIDELRPLAADWDDFAKRFSRFALWEFDTS